MYKQIDLCSLLIVWKRISDFLVCKIVQRKDSPFIFL
nr:MAG TPA: hypothetical protein [Caudoviricetes sp.]